MKRTTRQTLFGSIAVLLFVLPMVADSKAAQARIAEASVPADPLIAAEYVLPAYVNLPKATLLVRATKDRGDRPMELLISFQPRQGGSGPSGEIRTTLKPGEEQRVAAEIATWPDGDYRTEIRCIRDAKPVADPLVRWLRKQTNRAQESAIEPISVRGITTLFLDDWYVAKRTGLAVRRQLAEPFGVVTSILSPDSRQIFPTGGIELLADGSFRVGIRDADTDGESRYYTARSGDGLQWEVAANKPNVATPYTAPASPYWRPPAARVAPVAKTKVGQFRYYDRQRDGTVALDQVDLVFTGAESQKKNRWGDLTMPLRCTYPVWQKPDGESLILTREPLTADNHRQPEGSAGDWRDSNDNWIRPWRSADGRTLFYGHARLIPRHDPFRISYDHQKDALIGNYHRVMTLWQTTDGLQWTPSFFDPQREDDPPGWQGYGGSQFYAESGRLSLCAFFRYSARTQQMWPELLYSRDNMRWNRLDDHGPLVENGPWGSWNFGRMLGFFGNAVEKDGWIYQLFGNSDSRPHLYSTFIGHRRRNVTVDFLKGRFDEGIYLWPHWQRLGSWEGFAADAQTHCRTVGGMRYRKEGWVALTPIDGAGELVTKVLLPGEHLAINARTQREGRVVIEVLDADERPLFDFSGKNAAAFSGDSVNAGIQWKNGAQATLPRQPVRLRILLDRAELFALHWRQ